MIIVVGCERSGTTAIGKALAEEHELPYIHETYTRREAVIKHSLNMNQGLKHLELLDHMYPKARWRFVIRDGREVCRSMVQKVWKRHPHTMSLDEAITQWNHVNKTCYNFSRFMEVIRYEEFMKNPIIEWEEYFTEEQQQYMEERLTLEAYDYQKKWH